LLTTSASQCNKRFGYRPFLIGAQLGISAALLFWLIALDCAGLVFCRLSWHRILFLRRGPDGIAFKPGTTSLPRKTKAPPWLFPFVLRIGLLLAELIKTFYLHSSETKTGLWSF
jgi:hypothetical protein